MRDSAAMAELARDARVLINAVGPYTTHGDGAVAACAAAGTDYVDLAAEQEFVDRCVERHHDRAVQTGARIVHGCGFEAIPFDLGTLYTLERLPGQGPRSVTGYVQLGFGGLGRAARGFSTGSLRSALAVLSRPRERRPAQLRRIAPGPPDHRGVTTRRGRPHRSREPAGWALPAPRYSAAVVCRSADTLYGDDFSYEQYVLVPRLRTALAMGGALAAMLAVARVPALRRRALQSLPDGAGPSEEERRRRSFTVTLVGKAQGRRTVTRVAGGDPGYEESAKMLAESALCLAFDDLPGSAGETTPAVAMGDALIRRLVARGIVFSADTA